MKVHIVYCHPSERSITSEIRDAFIKGLKDSKKDYTISDLYRKGFITDMSEAEYLRDAFYKIELPLPQDVLDEQALVNAADALVFIYPVFWTEAPAKLVGWFDRVWSFGFAYGAKRVAEASVDKAKEKPKNLYNETLPMKTLEKTLVIAIAGNTEKVLHTQGRLQAMKNVMLADRINERAKHKAFVLLGGTERNDVELREQMREKHKRTAYQLALDL